MTDERYRVEQELFECRCCGYFYITDLDPSPTFVFDSTRAGEEFSQSLRADGWMMAIWRSENKVKIR